MMTKAQALALAKKTAKALGPGWRYGSDCEESDALGRAT
jgi:hypothetical protein